MSYSVNNKWEPESSPLPWNVVVAHRDQTVTKLNAYVVITWDLPLTIESNFGRPNSMRPFNECNPFAVPHVLCVNVCLCFPAPLTISAISAWMSLFFCQSHCQRLSSLFSACCLFFVLRLHSVSLSTPAAQSPWFFIQCSCHIIKSGSVTLGFTVTSLPLNLSD